MTPEHKWVSARAVAWVIHEAPVPADLAFTLTVIAAACDEHGRGCYQSIPTIGALTGKSPKQARRDVERLFDLGLIRLGDQSLTNHLPPGRRPVVYDVALDVRGPKPVKESKNPTGLKKTPRMDAGGSTDATPPMDGTPPFHGTPPMDAPGTPPMDGGSTPPMQGTPTPPMDGSQTTRLNNPLNNPGNNPESGGSSHVPTGFARETDDDLSNFNQDPDTPDASDGLSAPLASLATPQPPTPGAADEDTPPVVAEKRLSDKRQPLHRVVRPRLPADIEESRPRPVYTPCPACGTALDPDGSCFVCRTAPRARQAVP